jgi:hypothetical protein
MCNFFFKNSNCKYYFIFLFIIAYFFFLKSAYVSTDFGYHWDEDYSSIDSISKTFATATILPTNYNYPSFVYLLSLISSLFYYFGEYKIIGVGDVLYFTTIHSNKLNIIPFSISDFTELRIFLRKIFIILSSFASIFIFVAIKLFGLRWISALFGSLIILSSFHYWSLSRWIATDTVASTFISGAILMIVLYLKSRNINYIYLITVFVALATSTKYTYGLFLLIPIYYVNYEKFSIKNTTLNLLIFFSIFFLITPGSIVQPLKFIQYVYFEMRHYKVLGNSIYSIEPGLFHLKKLLEFIFFRITSTYTFVALFISLISCVGSYFFIIKKFKLKKKDDKAEKKEGSRPGKKIIIILILIFYILFFASQKAMIVRNYIFFLPFIAFFFSIAFNKIIEFFLIKKLYYQTFFLSILLISMFVVNFNKIYEASISIEYDMLIDQKKLIDKFVVINKDKKIALTGNASIFFKNSSKEELKEQDFDKIDFLVYLNYEFSYKYPEIEKKYYGKLANNINSYFLLSGPKDIDLDYYPNWLGKDRIIFVKDKEIIKLLLNLHNPSMLYYLKKI